jgi:hypothetical protein
MDNWKPIDSAPKDGTNVLLWARLKIAPPGLGSEPGPVVGFWHDAFAKWHMAPEYLRDELIPTHWTELPNPPTW